tara:strand:+ start:7233 stop:8033 length:801 start_codon:yes stop_codon:yes gene_type:complete
MSTIKKSKKTRYDIKFLKFNLLLVTILASAFAILSPRYAVVSYDTSRDNFLKITLTKSITLGCLDESSSNCSPQEASILEATASGMAFKEVNSSTYVLTADHFCSARADIPETTFISSDVETSLWVTGPDGISWPAEIVYTDKSYDLCLLRTRIQIKEGLEISRDIPVIGDRIFAVTAPLGINEKGVSVEFDGIFSGCDVYDRCYFTIPAIYGSSGSLVLDKNEKIVGMIQMTPANFNAMSIGVSSRTIRQFLQSAEDYLNIDLVD